MKHWKVTLKSNAPYRGALATYHVDADSKTEAIDQARRIARVEWCGALMTVISAIATTPVGSISGGAA